jgi:predicted dehydrogenase
MDKLSNRPPEGRLIRVGIVGCGDVAQRHYLPALKSMADGMSIADGQSHPVETGFAVSSPTDV